MLFGKYPLRLSENKLLALPSSYLPVMGKTVFLTQGMDRNLFLLSPQSFEAIYLHIKEISISDHLARLLRRLILGGAVEITVDGSGQIELPENLCEFASLGNEVILVGQGEYSEIWSPALWQEQEERLGDFDENAHRFEKFNVSLAGME
jgi:MraZ protein